MAVKDKNLFLVLGKYVRRQNENLLTQSLAGLFNNAERFRKDFVALIEKRGNLSRSPAGSAFFARTQRSEKLSTGRIIIDLEVLEWAPRPELIAPPTVFVIEAKLHAQLSPSQILKYAKFLNKQRGNAKLVLLTRGGFDPMLSSYLPRDTVWLTWSEIGELCRRPIGVAGVERFLRKEFVTMLDEIDIPSAPPISRSNWTKIALFGRFAISQKTSNLHYDAFEIVNVLIARMRIHTDIAWSGLSVDGYKPYARAYANRNDGEPYTVIGVGYYFWEMKKSKLYERFIGLGLDCINQKLYAYAGWDLKKDHPSYSDGEWEEKLHEWTRKETMSLFSQPIAEAQEVLSRQLVKGLDKFKKTRYFSK